MKHVSQQPSRAQHGDTIVEVLICIAVVGAVLAGAFVVSNRSQLGVRDSQEHAEASKVVESQLEQLRSNAKSGDRSALDQPVGASFCMSGGKAVAYSGTPPNECKLTNQGTAATATDDHPYVINVARTTDTGVSGTGRTYKIDVSWDSIQGSQAQESMLYRVYP